MLNHGADPSPSLTDLLLLTPLYSTNLTPLLLPTAPQSTFVLFPTCFSLLFTHSASLLLSPFTPFPFSTSLLFTTSTSLSASHCTFSFDLTPPFSSSLFLPSPPHFASLPLFFLSSPPDSFSPLHPTFSHSASLLLTLLHATYHHSFSLRLYNQRHSTSSLSLLLTPHSFFLRHLTLPHSVFFSLLHRLTPSSYSATIHIVHLMSYSLHPTFFTPAHSSVLFTPFPYSSSLFHFITCSFTPFLSALLHFTPSSSLSLLLTPLHSSSLHLTPL